MITGYRLSVAVAVALALMACQVSAELIRMDNCAVDTGFYTLIDDEIFPPENVTTPGTNNTTYQINEVLLFRIYTTDAPRNLIRVREFSKPYITDDRQIVLSELGNAGCSKATWVNVTEPYPGVLASGYSNTFNETIVAYSGQVDNQTAVTLISTTEITTTKYLLENMRVYPKSKVDGAIVDYIAGN